MRHTPRQYEPSPRYPSVGGVVEAGWGAVRASLPEGPLVLAVDGPWILGWDNLVAQLARAVPRPRIIDLRGRLAGWAEILKLTEPDVLADDPYFAPLCDADLSLLVGEPPAIDPVESLTVVCGPGAALVPHDVLWYADLPKRYAEAAVTGGTGRNLGQPPDTGRHHQAPVLHRLAAARPAPRRHRGPDRPVVRRPGPGTGRRLSAGDPARDAAALARPTVPHPADLQHHALGRPLGAAGARPQPRRAGTPRSATS